jgi:hypothetical protein
MNQKALFHETLFDAIGADVLAAGGFKKVAGVLWPSDSSGAAKLRNALNPEQPHKLCPEEVLQIKRLAQEAGSTETIQFEAQQLGYVCTWIDPEDEAERIERENNEMLKRLIRNQERAESLRARVRAVK